MIHRLDGDNLWLLLIYYAEAGEVELRHMPSYRLNDSLPGDTARPCIIGNSTTQQLFPNFAMMCRQRHLCHKQQLPLHPLGESGYLLHDGMCLPELSFPLIISHLFNKASL